MARERDSNGIILLRIVFYFTLLFSIVELFAGLYSKSLLLIEESIHMFADSISFGVNLWAELKSQDEAERAKAQFLGTLVSFLTLSGTFFAVFMESLLRLGRNETVQVDANVMLGFGIALSCFHAASLLAYFCGFNALHSHSHGHEYEHGHSHGEKTLEDSDCEENDATPEENHNLSSAIFHVFVDFLHSFLVVLTAIVVIEFEEKKSGQIDAIASLFLCFVIFSGCVVLFKSLLYQYRNRNKYTKIEVELPLE